MIVYCFKNLNSIKGERERTKEKERNKQEKARRRKKKKNRGRKKEKKKIGGRQKGKREPTIKALLPSNYWRADCHLQAIEKLKGRREKTWLTARSNH